MIKKLKKQPNQHLFKKAAVYGSFIKVIEKTKKQLFMEVF